MRVLVACEFSGVVRRAFQALGHDAWSCDILPAEDCDTPDPLIRGKLATKHIQADVLGVLYGPWLREPEPWDLMIAHPPCTHLAVSGARWFKEKVKEQAEALEFVQRLLDAPVPRIALENPISVISSKIRKPTQIIHPWMFGHGEVKATCLWLKNLPPLAPTMVVEGREPRVWKMGPSPDRWKERSRTLPGIAAAMAAQWGGLEIEQPELCVSGDSSQ